MEKKVLTTPLRAEDLEDILYRQNIESYRVPGHEVDVRRQKIIQTVPTDDKSKDNLVAVRVADGYERVIRFSDQRESRYSSMRHPLTIPPKNKHIDERNKKHGKSIWY